MIEKKYSSAFSYAKTSTMKSKIIIYAISIISIFLIAFFFGTFHNKPSKEIEDWAHFGTYMTFCISAISIILLYKTYKSQVWMSETLQFESLYFQWLSIHKDLYNENKNDIHKSYLTIIKNIKDIKDFEILYKTNVDYVESESRNTSSYYRHYFQIIRYIKQNISVERQKKYYDILQSQMNNEELFIVLTCIINDKRFKSENLQSDFIKTIDKNHLLKNIYYSKKNPNFKEFKDFMFKIFPLTQEHRSFYCFNDENEISDAKFD